jgi:hypothetical protein
MTIIEYLGLTINTGKMIVKIPENKISELKDKIMFAMGNSKVTLRTLQSLAGSLAFCLQKLQHIPYLNPLHYPCTIQDHNLMISLSLVCTKYH